MEASLKNLTTSYNYFHPLLNTAPVQDLPSIPNGFYVSDVAMQAYNPVILNPSFIKIQEERTRIILINYMFQEAAYKGYDSQMIIIPEGSKIKKKRNYSDVKNPTPLEVESDFSTPE